MKRNKNTKKKKIKAKREKILIDKHLGYVVQYSYNKLTEALINFACF